MPIVFATPNSYYSVPRRPTYPSQSESYWNDIAEEHERRAAVARARAEEEAQLSEDYNYFLAPQLQQAQVPRHYRYPSVEQQLRDDKEARIRQALAERRRQEQEAYLRQQQLEAAAAERERLLREQQLLREREQLFAREQAHRRILQQRQSQLEEAAVFEAWKHVLAGAAAEEQQAALKGKAKETVPVAPRHVRFFTHAPAEKVSLLAAPFMSSSYSHELVLQESQPARVPVASGSGSRREVPQVHITPPSPPLLPFLTSDPSQTQNKPTTTQAQAPSAVHTIYYEAAAKIQRLYKSHHERLNSLNQINSISSQFDALRSAFEFPEAVDFLTSSSDITATPKLAFTPNNSTIHTYENTLTKLLTSLDSVGSHGSTSIREARREVVQRIELQLEALEARKVTLWQRANAGSQPQPQVETGAQNVEVDAQEGKAVEDIVVEKEIAAEEAAATTSNDDMDVEAHEVVAHSPAPTPAHEVIDQTLTSQTEAVGVTAESSMEVEPQEPVVHTPAHAEAVEQPTATSAVATEFVESTMDVVEEPSSDEAIKVTVEESPAVVDELASSMATVIPVTAYPRARALSEPTPTYPTFEGAPAHDFAILDTEPEVDTLESASDSSISSTEAEAEEDKKMEDGDHEDFEMI
jgi:hypothetical protein